MMEDNNILEKKAQSFLDTLYIGTGKKHVPKLLLLFVGVFQ